MEESSNCHDDSEGEESTKLMMDSCKELNTSVYCVSTSISRMIDSAEESTDIELQEAPEDTLENKRHLCNVCHESFSRLRDLKEHVTIHTGLKAYPCDMCNKGFSQPSSLFTHKKVHRMPDIAVCDICCRKFAGPSSLKKHRLSHLAQRRHPCRHCDKSFAYPSGLREHEICHLRLEPGTEESGDAERTEDDFDLHQPHSSEVGSNSFELDTSENTTDTSVPSQPTTEPQAARNYPCQFCSESFLNSKQLAGHMRSHNYKWAASWLCKVCGKTFSNQKRYASHMLVHKGVKPYSCDQCEAAYAQLNSLKVHKLVHTGKVPFTCEECGKSFLIRNFLKEHQRLHTGEKPYVCEDCSKTFRTAKLLRKHRTVHTREYGSESSAKPADVSQDASATTANGSPTSNPVWINDREMWKCFVCGKAFKYPSYLDRHKFVHEDQQRYYCEPCDRTFMSLMAFRGHQAKHRGGDEEARCPECGKTFASSRSLSSHMRAHDAVEEWFTCGVCQKSYQDSDQLVGHMIEHGEAGMTA